jgi:ATP-binding cassette subfamily C protein CydD
MRAIDPRLLQHARAARVHLVVAVLLGLAVTGLIVAQAALLAHALSAAALGTGARALAGTLVLLLGAVLARAAAAYGGEAAALRAAARVKSQLRHKLTRHCLRLGPGWLGGQQPGRIAALATRGWTGLILTSRGTCRR